MSKHRRLVAPLDGHAYVAREGLRGLDCNTPLTPLMASLIAKNGAYQFVVRYVARQLPTPVDLTRGEADAILDAGLGLMVVQHVEQGLWTPTAVKGEQYGAAAVAHLAECGLPGGVMCWLDMESVAPTSHAVVIEYCNRWFSVVAGAGYVAGQYCGWHPGLPSTLLYSALHTRSYWGAYNANADEVPAVRGVQMQQRVALPANRIQGLKLAFDVNDVVTDHLGARPIVFAR